MNTASVAEMIPQSSAAANPAARSLAGEAHTLRKLIREAEALSDEAMIACARLKQAMLTARQNPAVEVHAGQRALMRLSQAEAQALAMSTSLLRVHDELSRLAEVHAGADGPAPTRIPLSALAASPADEVQA